MHHRSKWLIYGNNQFGDSLILTHKYNDYREGYIYAFADQLTLKSLILGTGSTGYVTV